MACPCLSPGRGPQWSAQSRAAAGRRAAKILDAWVSAADGAGRRAVLPVLRRQAATAAAGAGEELLHCCRSARLPEPVDPGRAVFPTVHKSGAVGVRAMSGDAVAEMIQRRAAAAEATAAQVQRHQRRSVRLID